MCAQFQEPRRLALWYCYLSVSVKINCTVNFKTLKSIFFVKFFFNFFIVTSNFTNLMYARSFLYDGAKIKQHPRIQIQSNRIQNPRRKEFSAEAIWECRFTCFFISVFCNRHSNLHQYFSLATCSHGNLYKINIFLMCAEGTWRYIRCT